MPAKKVVKKAKKLKVGAVIKPKFECSLEVEVNDIVYKGEAETLDQALRDFVNSPSFPFNVKTRVLIRYGNGKDAGQVIWPTVKARRQFNLISLKPYWSELIANKFESNLVNG